MKEKNKNEKIKYNMWQNAAWMIGIAWREKEKKVIFICLASALVAVSFNLIELFVVPTILDAIVARVNATRLIGMILGFAAAMMLCQAAMAYIAENHKFGKMTVRSAIYGQVTNKLMTTSYPNVNCGEIWKLRAHVDASVGTEDGAIYGIWQTMTDLLKNLLGFAIYVMMLTTIHPLFLLMILITSVISYAVAKRCSNYRYENREQEDVFIKRLSYIHDLSRDTVAAKDIHIFGLRTWLEDIHRKTLESYEAFHARVHAQLLIISITDLVLTVLRNALAYVWLVGMVIRGTLSASEFLLYFTAVTGFAAWVTGILDTISTFHRHSNELLPVRELLEYPEVFCFGDGESLVHTPGKQYEIRLENVSYRYPEAERDTLHGIDLTLKPGEKIAVVGLNGAGKTTLIKILCGFLDPTEGRVLIDGRDIREYNRRDYYMLFSAVFQDFSLLPTTIAANVAQSEDDIDLARVKDCIARAGLKEKIESQPRKYHTLLNREVHNDAIMLSGGETQRLMLARALYKDAPIIVLDEPTAALDPIAEADMYAKYHEMTKGRSSVYISHRLASTRFCDRILLIENAVIAEEGTHDELLARGGKYAELFEIQSQYYREGGADDEER